MIKQIIFLVLFYIIFGMLTYKIKFIRKNFSGMEKILTTVICSHGLAAFLFAGLGMFSGQ